MLKIKLQPTGKKHQRYYRIVIAEGKSKLGGKVIDTLGTYNPHDIKNTLELNMENYQSWLTKGAQPTDTIRKLVNKQK